MRSRGTLRGRDRRRCPQLPSGWSPARRRPPRRDCAGIPPGGPAPRGWAQGHQEEFRRNLVAAAGAAQETIRWGAVGSAVGLALAALLGIAFLERRFTARVFATVLILLVGADLWRAGRRFWHWSRRPARQRSAPTRRIRTVA